MKTNVSTKSTPEYTHEGAKAIKLYSPEQQLRRTVMSCLLWEDDYYEDGVAISNRIREYAEKVPVIKLAEIIVEVREKFYLRHIPLFLLVTLIARSKSSLVADTIYKTIQRPDELGELLSLYWHDGKKSLSAQLKKGLAKAFTKFNAYSLSKYNRDSKIKLRDVMFLVHPKPKDKDQEEVFKKLANNTLESPDTWEVALSAGADKKETFERLLKENKLGYLALLRNLRNMMQANVDPELVREAIKDTANAKKILPFRFIAAARAAPLYEKELDEAMESSIAELPKLSGLTVVMMDVSGSMQNQLSSKSDMVRMDAGSALASIIRSDELRIFTFSEQLIEVPSNRRGMSGVDAIRSSQLHMGTYLRKTLDLLYQEVPKMTRLIVISDEQITHEGNASGTLPAPNNALAYMINVGTSKNGVGYGKWTHIDGFSENIIRYIYEIENTSEVID